uniref:Selection and upkeep of intraepithelial T-cells protein 1 n=1 Tax=Maylandia zebra TaxID=106582 RepID=A0A3P9DHK8_9CICH
MSRLSSSSYTFPLWTLILCSAFLIAPVQGKVLVIGSNLPIIAAPGDDVILPCHLEPTFDVQGLTVEWSKPDLKPDPSDRLSRVEYVHLYRDRKEVPDMKMASYFRRTELFMDDMKHGNISLKILNVSEEDNGRYRCFIPKLQSRVKAAVVELVVDSNFAKTSETPLQTPDPQDTTPTNGENTVQLFSASSLFGVLCICGEHLVFSMSAGRFRVAVVLIAFISAVAVAGLTVYFCCHHQHQTVSKKQTNKHKLVVASCAVRMSHYSPSFSRSIQRRMKQKHYQSSCLLKGVSVLMELRAAEIYLCWIFSQIGASSGLFIELIFT